MCRACSRSWPSPTACRSPSSSTTPTSRDPSDIVAKTTTWPPNQTLLPAPVRPSLPKLHSTCGHGPALSLAAAGSVAWSDRLGDVSDGLGDGSLTVGELDDGPRQLRRVERFEDELGDVVAAD